VSTSIHSWASTQPSSPTRGLNGCRYDLGMKSLQELRSLPVAERIQLVEDLWDSIVEDSYRLQLTQSQREESSSLPSPQRSDQSHRLVN
jgi:hypothetical protein